MKNEVYEQAKAIASARDKMQELLDIVKGRNSVMLTISSDQFEDDAKARIQDELLKRFEEVLTEEVSRLEKEFERL